MSAPKSDEKPKLIHNVLHNVPQTVRFAISGLLCNVIFLTGFNEAVHLLEKHYSASTIYSVFYLFFIPVGHAINSLLVFGWPKPYLPSLLSNAPIGITAMMLGTFCTGYFDQISFNDKVGNFLYNNFASVMGPRMDAEQEGGEFYSSLAVSIITGIWSFVLSMIVNAPPPKKSKGDKEL